MASTLRKRCLESFGSKDLFYIFGFTSDIEQVTEDQINQAYKARVRLYHPDKHATGSEKEKFNAAEKFKIFTEAKNVLLNFEKREFYLSTGRLDDEEDQSDDEEAESDDDLEPPVLEQQCVLKSEEANESFESDGITSDDNAEEQFEVEKILAKRKRNGKIEYCIKWKDYGSEHNSWEKIDNCDCPDLIKEFEGAFSPKKKVNNQHRPKNSHQTTTKSAEVIILQISRFFFFILIPFGLMENVIVSVKLLQLKIFNLRNDFLHLNNHLV